MTDKTTKILINLTGDYLIANEETDTLKYGCVATDPNLHELDAFLGALRGSVNLKRDLFLGSVSAFVSQITSSGSNLALEITSTIEGKTLRHQFKLVVSNAES